MKYAKEHADVKSILTYRSAPKTKRDVAFTVIGVCRESIMALKWGTAAVAPPTRPLVTENSTSASRLAYVQDTNR